MKRKIYIFVSVLVSVAILIFLGVQPGWAKDSLVVARQDDTASLDPAKSYEQGGWGILDQIYEKLVNFRGDDFSHVVPELAESWHVSDDGKIWTFYIRNNVRFSSGNPLTADAVIFSLRRALTLAANSSWVLTQFGLTTDSIVKIDNYTVQIVLQEPYAPGLFLASLTPPIGSILDPKIVMEHEQNNDLGSAWLEEHSAGTGPYVLTKRTYEDPTQYMLTANEHYWREPPIFANLDVRGIQEPFEQMLMLQQGEIDIAWNLKTDQVVSLTGNPDIQIAETLTLYITYVWMNQGFAPFSNQHVRQAIRYAINYDDMIMHILQGAGETIQTFIPKGLFGYTSKTEYGYDPERAIELLTEGGFPNGFTVTLKCLDYSPWIELASWIQKDLAEIGITVEILQMDGAKLYQEALGVRDFELLLWEWGIDYPDPDSLAKPFAHSDSLGEDATIQMLAWWCKYVNPETSMLSEQAARELNEKKRAELYQKITDIIRVDGPYVPLYNKIHQYGVRTDVSDSIKKPAISWYYFPSLK